MTNILGLVHECTQFREVIRQRGYYAGKAPEFVRNNGTVRMQTVHYTIEILDVPSLYIHINIRCTLTVYSHKY